MWPVTWPTEANENTRVARDTLSAITVGSSNLCTGPKFRAAAPNIVADHNYSVVLDLIMCMCACFVSTMLWAAMSCSSLRTRRLGSRCALFLLVKMRSRCQFTYAYIWLINNQRGSRITNQCDWNELKVAKANQTILWYFRITYLYPYYLFFSKSFERLLYNRLLSFVMYNANYYMSFNSGSAVVIHCAPEQALTCLVD